MRLQKGSKGQEVAAAAARAERAARPRAAATGGRGFRPAYRNGRARRTEAAWSRGIRCARRGRRIAGVRRCGVGGVDRDTVAGRPLPWLDIARREIGQKERKGLPANPRILAYIATFPYLADVPYPPQGVPMSQTDETAWCACFVNWCLLRAGQRGGPSAKSNGLARLRPAPRRAAARCHLRDLPPQERLACRLLDRGRGSGAGSGPARRQPVGRGDGPDNPRRGAGLSLAGVSGEEPIRLRCFRIGRGRPSRVTEIAAAAAARRIAAAKGSPRSSPAASTPHQQSPAPVVSTAATGKASARTCPKGPAASAPLSPSVTATPHPSAAASAAASPATPRRPPIHAASPSFTISRSSAAKHVAVDLRRRRQVEQHPRAAGTGASDQYLRLGAGISICSSSVAPRSAASGTCAARTERSAPEATAIWLRPCRIDADGGTAGRRSHLRQQGEIHPPRAQRRRGHRCHGIAPNGAGEGHGRPVPCRRHRLIGALAAGQGAPAGAEHRLTRRGQMRDAEDQIRIGRTEATSTLIAVRPCRAGRWRGRARSQPAGSPA